MDTLEKYKKGYKVVRRYSLKSSVIINIFCVIKYKINKWVKPKNSCGPLCIFDNLSLAANYATKEFESIYECLYEPTSVKYVYINKENLIKLNCLPTGTVLASKVKLIRRVR